MSTVDESAHSSLSPPSLARFSSSARIGGVLDGTYRLLAPIGRGGSSDVFRARHVRLGNQCAVKVLRSDLVDRGAARRFRREARVLARVECEFVVRVLDVGETEDGAPYIVLELLEGENLRVLLNREGALPVGRALHILAEACKGIAAVHGAGLVHRDLKPENLFITRRVSGEDWCKVLDFGVAKVVDSEATVRGAMLGTARYAAPEQLLDSASVGPAADVYALGAILYESLAGTPLVDGKTVEEVMYAVMHREPRPLRELRPELAPPLRDLIERSISKRPAQRPQSAREMLECLRAAGAGTEATVELRTAVEESPRAPRVAATGVRSRLLAGSALVLMGCWLGWSARGTHVPNGPRRSGLTPPAAASVGSPRVPDEARPSSSVCLSVEGRPQSPVPAGSARPATPGRTAARSAASLPSAAFSPAADGRSIAPLPSSFSVVAGFDQLNPYER